MIKMQINPETGKIIDFDHKKIEFHRDFLFIECPRCSREHKTLSEELSGELWNVCESCLEEDERSSLLQTIRENISSKYSIDIININSES